MHELDEPVASGPLHAPGDVPFSNAFFCMDSEIREFEGEISMQARKMMGEAKCGGLAIVSCSSGFSQHYKHFP